mmetsp:Transcript_615/g.1700  ORF Transcript_615/g.1700 Transcript_615/m.1700 type:complete len:337 (-) Transcript_615:1311-2321(-)
MCSVNLPLARDARNASASSINTSTPRVDVRAHRNKAWSAVTPSGPSGPTSPPLISAYSRPVALAKRLAQSVLPVPGGPCSSMWRKGLRFCFALRVAVARRTRRSRRPGGRTTPSRKSVSLFTNASAFSSILARRASATRALREALAAAARAARRSFVLIRFASRAWRRSAASMRALRAPSRRSPRMRAASLRLNEATPASCARRSKAAKRAAAWFLGSAMRFASTFKRAATANAIRPSSSTRASAPFFTNRPSARQTSSSVVPSSRSQEPMMDAPLPVLSTTMRTHSKPSSPATRARSFTTANGARTALPNTKEARSRRRAARTRDVSLTNLGRPK